MSYVNINHIYKSYGEEQVLDNVSFVIERGECFGLIGPNGAGKSTLIDIITGLTPFNSGNVQVDNLNVPTDIVTIRKQIGLVPQEIALMQELNAIANLEYFGGLYGLSGKLLKERIQEALEVIGLTNHVKKPVKTFSGGMQRRLNIAAGILHRPNFLILDEPTVGVDPQSRNKIFEFIKYMIHEYGTTVLYTSHYMEEVEALCDRLFILDKGHQIGYGSQSEIKQMVQDNVKWYLEIEQAPLNFDNQLTQKLSGVQQVISNQNKYHLIVDPLEFSTKALLNLIADLQLELTTLNKEELSLEEAFLQLTGKSLRD
ncbi:ABC transporter ATP-binding protein [Fundicoccus culcitae]|uniref:ABC transporter ATP-binding protein n=1 Tax=Fundicoccus culcitae TaxID=2969821 RepID=A0ABY5P7M4_9LACT|nr:ABC transporter ATP-binding protein [Fundicoccus culcitae]UUX34736.1 ABC transporter ATP-binding protein [Fundicoccus culcitae]